MEGEPVLIQPEKIEPIQNPLAGRVIALVQSGRAATVFVLIVWAAMLLAALVCLALYGRNIPMTEDWHLVPALTGNEPDIPAWLWSQNNEHRIPLPRLILLALLALTHGDFRVGMLLSILVLGALALAFIYVTRSLRGGRSHWTDAFFPIALLHLGNWENLFWGWQFSFVLPTALVCVLLLLLVRNQAGRDPRDAAIAGMCLVALPLSGANGLAFVPLLALWFGANGWMGWRADRADPVRRRAGHMLVGSAVLALALTGLYFVGYQDPTWTPPNPGIWPSLRTTLQFLSLSFGPVARMNFTPFMIASLAIFLATAGLVAHAVWKQRGAGRLRAAGLFAFVANMAAFALLLGWGRAAVIEIYGQWPLRYVLLAAPALFVAYYVWELFGSPRLRALVQGGLFLAAVLLIPANTVHGSWWRDWYLDGVRAVQADLDLHAPAAYLAEHNQEFLYHSMETSDLAARITMLEQSGMSLFGQSPAATQDDQALLEQEIRYQAAAAGEVFLVWGVNGWNPLPDSFRPPGTLIKNNVMHTAMERSGENFVIRVTAPASSVIDFGFLITRDTQGKAVSIWDGNADQDYHIMLNFNGLVVVQSNR